MEIGGVDCISPLLDDIDRRRDPRGREVEASMLDRRARAERFREFFEVQLRFAQFIAERTRTPLREIVVTCTNLHRRFGFGDPDISVSPLWEHYVCQLEGLGNIDDRVAWTQEFFETAPEEALPLNQRFFGCFGCEPPSDRGIIRIHFVNREHGEVAPIHRSRIARRRRDLAEMFAFVGENYPSAVGVKGISWLYHLDAYRRLFPPEYGASAAPADRVRLSGMSSWGQFLTHSGAIKPALRDTFLRSFDGMDISAPWRSFPLPALVASAPMARFREFYSQ